MYNGGPSDSEESRIEGDDCAAVQSWVKTQETSPGSQGETGDYSPWGVLGSPFIALTGLAAIIAVIVRWYRLGSQSLWVDEGYTLWLSQLTPKAIWHAVQTDTSPPLYYLLHHTWIHRFG